MKNRAKILDYYLYYEDLKDSTDNYDMEKCQEFQKKLISIIGNESLAAIKDLSRADYNKSKMMLANSFGEKSLFQIYYDYNEKENVFIKMEIESFKAENVGEWVGMFPIYIESKVGDNEVEVTGADVTD
jgi:hypothetical protein